MKKVFFGNTHVIHILLQALNTLIKISDGSLDDIVLPTVSDELFQIDVKEEFLKDSESPNFFWHNRSAKRVTSINYGNIRRVG